MRDPVVARDRGSLAQKLVKDRGTARPDNVADRLVLQNDDNHMTEVGHVLGNCGSLPFGQTIQTVRAGDSGGGER